MLLCWLLRSPTKHTLKHCWLLFGSLLNWMLWPTECNHWGRFRMIKCTSYYQYFHTIGTSLTLLWEFTFGKESMPISIFFTKQMEKKIFKLKAVQLIFCNDFKCCLMNSFCLLDIRSCQLRNRFIYHFRKGYHFMKKASKDDMFNFSLIYFFMHL